MTRLWPSTNGGADGNDTSSVDLGLQFTVSAPGYQLQGYYVWVASDGAQDTTGSDYQWRLYTTTTGTSGTLVSGGAVNMSGTLTIGAWNYVALASPVALTSGVTYVAVFTNPGTGGTSHTYSATGNYWSTGAGSAGITNGVLSAPSAASAAGGIQCGFNEPTTGGFPSHVFDASNYWIDVEVDSSSTPVSDTDSGHGEDSGFTFLAASDASTASDGAEQASLRAADAASGDDEPTAAWPSDSDSARAADNSSSWPHDTDACTASEDWQKTRTFTDSDVNSALDSEHGQVEVFSYQPDFRWTGGGYELVWVVPDSDGGFAGLTVWRGPVPDAGVYRLAQQLHEAAPSAHVHDSDQATSRHEHTAPSFGTAIHAGRALTVTVEVRA